MRLIDVDALIDAHYEACNKDKRKTFPGWSLMLMWDAPTVDAVPMADLLEAVEKVIRRGGGVLDIYDLIKWYGKE